MVEITLSLVTRPPIRPPTLILKVPDWRSLDPCLTRMVFRWRPEIRPRKSAAAPQQLWVAWWVLFILKRPLLALSKSSHWLHLTLHPPSLYCHHLLCPFYQPQSTREVVWKPRLWRLMKASLTVTLRVSWRTWSWMISPSGRVLHTASSNIFYLLQSIFYFGWDSQLVVMESLQLVVYLFDSI